MAEHRIWVVGSPAHLSIDVGRLKLEQADKPPQFIAPADLAALVLEHPTISLTQAVLRQLAHHGAVVLTTDEAHLPLAISLPLAKNQQLALRLRQQIALDALPLRATLWQQIVAAKLRMQAFTLRALNRQGALRLERMANQVKPGDEGHLEGQGARHYFSHLMADFRREKEGATDPINSRLNYGYAVLRAFVARALVQAGLTPALGLYHSNASNPFNLADDWMEPLRPLVDFYVVKSVERAQMPDLDRAAKREVLNFTQASIMVGKNDWRLPSGIEHMLDGFIRVLEQRGSVLDLPHGFTDEEA